MNVIDHLRSALTSLWTVTGPGASSEKITHEFARDNQWLWLSVSLVCCLLCWWIYRRDTREFGGIRRILPLLFRFGVWAGLLVIFLDPQERTESEVVRPSRVAILVDTSASMGFPEKTASPEMSVVKTRIESVREILGSEGFQRDLSAIHEIELYAFDQQLRFLGRRAKGGGRI